MRDVVLVPTEAAKRSLSETHPNVHVDVLPPGVDVGTLDWRPRAQHEVARLLYLGTFTADRELPTLLEAVRRVRATRPVKVLIAGDPDRSRRDRLRQIVDAFDLRDSVDIRGEPAARAIPGVIAAADLCLATAAAAPRFQVLGDLPQPLFEYMACRRPVIAAAVPGVGEVLRDEHEGLLYPPGDDETLAAAILEVLGSTKTAERLTDGGLSARARPLLERRTSPPRRGHLRQDPAGRGERRPVGRRLRGGRDRTERVRDRSRRGRAAR
jgi:glycosyltransferase involved in cell wall biosynthesis